MVEESVAAKRGIDYTGAQSTEIERATEGFEVGVEFAAPRGSVS